MKAFLLLPFTLMYYFVNIFWDIYWKLRKPTRVNSKVISVGNIAVGGSGKTTIAGFIAQRLIADGKKTAIVARGYARPEKGPVVLRSGEEIDWRKCGDEPAALAGSIKGLTIYVDSNKTSAALRAASDGYEHIIVDDGFQHRDLYRDIDIVCLEGKRPFGNGLLLPSGILREPRRALKRADIIIIVDPPSDKKTFKINTPAAVFTAHKKIAGIKSQDGIMVDLSGKKVVAFCGLGNPESFGNSLAGYGCRTTDFVKYRDHHGYDRKDIAYIIERVCATEAVGAVTTLKDLVKVESLWDTKYNLYCLETAIELENERGFLKLVGL